MCVWANTLQETHKEDEQRDFPISALLGLRKQGLTGEEVSKIEGN